MKRTIKAIPLNLIKLDQENVRFGGDIAQNQREAIDLMMADPEDAKKILKLADHIAEHGLDPTELQLVTPEKDGYYVVLEGNRRLTALKLLQKPDLCPEEKLVKGFFAAHQKLNGNLPTEVECSIVPTRAAGDMWIELKHTGQNAGVGRVNWDSDIRDERRARQTGIESIGRQIRNLVKDNETVFSPHTVRDIFAIPVTTLTRLFSSMPAQKAFQIKIENKELTPILPLKYIAPAIEFAINMFENEGYNVNDIRNDDDRKRFVGHIPPELDPIKLAAIDTNAKKENDETKNIQAHADKLDSETIPDGGESHIDMPKDLPHENHKTRAKPSSRSRKFLIPWSLNISNSRINEIYRELRKSLEVDKCPNATAITFRVFLEVSCDSFSKRQEQENTPITREDNAKPLTELDKLSVKIKAVAVHLEKQGLISVSQSKTICKRATSKDTVGSVDHFNQFIHGTDSPPIPSELKDIAEEYRPMLEAIWR